MMADSLSRVRKLIWALMISGALNIVIAVFFFYWAFSESAPVPYCELKPASKQEQQVPLAIDHSNSELIRCFRKMPMDQLVVRLTKTQLVENGYALRDLALACLIDFHGFDIKRALIGVGQPTQQRKIIYGRCRNGQPAELTVYPGLSDQQFQAIVHFAATERWPLTSKGLFLALRRQAKDLEDSLVDAFWMTPEFMVVETLFTRSEVPVEREELLQVILEGNWPMLSQFVEQQKISQDLSSPRRHRFLLDYVQRKSKAAAQLMLKIDETVAILKLDDSQVIQFLELLEEKSVEAEKFALALLTSPRSDAVWRKAAARLYAYAGEEMPEKYHHHAALSRFLPSNTVMPLNEPAEAIERQKAPVAPSQTIVAAAPALAQRNAAIPAPVHSSPVVAQVTAKEREKPKLRVNNILPPISSEAHLKREQLYIVQEGDSLWKISRRFDIDVNRLKSHNKLQSDFLKPGRPLLIPKR